MAVISFFAQGLDHDTIDSDGIACLLLPKPDADERRQAAAERELCPFVIQGAEGATLRFCKTGFVVESESVSLELVLVPSAVIDERAEADNILCIAAAYPEFSVALKFDSVNDLGSAKVRIQNIHQAVLWSLHTVLPACAPTLTTTQLQSRCRMSGTFCIGGWVIISGHTNMDDPNAGVLIPSPTFDLVWAELYLEANCCKFVTYSGPELKAFTLGVHHIGIDFGPAGEVRIFGPTLVVFSERSRDGDLMTEDTYITFLSHQEARAWVHAEFAVLKHTPPPQEVHDVIQYIAQQRCALSAEHPCLLSRSDKIRQIDELESIDELRELLASEEDHVVSGTGEQATEVIVLC